MAKRSHVDLNSSNFLLSNEINKTYKLKWLPQNGFILRIASFVINEICFMSRLMLLCLIVGEIKEKTVSEREKKKRKRNSRKSFTFFLMLGFCLNQIFHRKIYIKIITYISQLHLNLKQYNLIAVMDPRIIYRYKELETEERKI